MAGLLADFDELLTIAMPVRGLINIKRRSRLEQPADFSSRDVCSHHTESNAVPTEIPDRRELIFGPHLLY